MSLSYKNRIALYYMMATAIIMALVFSIIYLLVHETIYNNLDNDLTYEAEKHKNEISFSESGILFNNKEEWAEREHREIQVNPVFLQLMDRDGKIKDKSPNLKDDALPFYDSRKEGFFNTQLSKRPVRQIQAPIVHKGSVEGYILAAMSSEAAESVTERLQQLLLVSYFIVLIGLYFTSRFLAGKSIAPVKEVSHTISRITKHNLRERVALPKTSDEIHELSLNFNSLLDRIEDALERERQFTSDASHELRTPLAVLRGTLEVLIRKPRTREEYEDKIRYALGGISKMTETLEQLLLMARLDSGKEGNEIKMIQLPAIIDNSLAQLHSEIEGKGLKIKFDFDEKSEFSVPDFYSSLIVDNLVSNAVKYSLSGGIIRINAVKTTDNIIFKIEDYGIGIQEADLNKIFDNFYRSNALDHKQIQGNGLGLSIVKKCVGAIGAEIKIESKTGEGTCVSVFF